MRFDGLNTIRPSLLAFFRITENNNVENGKSFGKRITDEYELDFITCSNGGYIVTDGEVTQLERGMLFFRKPGVLVEGCSEYCCYFIKISMQDFDNIDFLKVLKVSNIPYFEGLFAKLYQTYLDRCEATDFLTATIVMSIFMALYEETLEAVKLRNRLPRDDGRISGIREYIESNLQKGINLTNLAKLNGYSIYDLCRQFKKEAGLPPMKYLAKCRIINASKLLVETNKSIKQIMLESGFKNESIFFRAFKSYTGYTPREYRTINALPVLR
jgi:AraC-type DNA-binding domain-containing proteins